MNLNHIAKKPFFDLFWKQEHPACLQWQDLPFLTLLTLTEYKIDGNLHCPMGPNAGIRFKEVLNLPHNQGLKPAVKNILDIKEDGNHITQLLTLSDLIQLGGYCAIQYCGGPTIPFKMGRKDTYSASQVESQQLHDVMTPSQLRAHFNKMSIRADHEIVALMGWRTIDMRNESPSGRWTKNPYRFDNSYYKQLLLGEHSMYLKTQTDFSLLQDEEFRKFVNQFADDQDVFFEEFQKAYVKLSEAGYDNLLGQY